MFEHAKLGSVDIISGDDPLNVEHLEEASRLLDDCISEGQPRVVFDLEYIPLIDSAGLELLLDVRARCVRRGGMLQIAAPNNLCRNILTVTDVASQFEIFNNVLSAVGSFAQ